MKKFSEALAEIERKNNARTPIGWLRRRRIGDWNAWYALRHPWKIPGYYWRSIKYFVQRGRRGWSDLDAMSMDVYLLEIIPAMIRQEILGGHTHPHSMTYDEWQETLTYIVEGLEQYRHTDASAYFDSYEERNDRFREAWNDMGKHFDSLWD